MQLASLQISSKSSLSGQNCGQRTTYGIHNVRGSFNCIIFLCPLKKYFFPRQPIRMIKWHILGTLIPYIYTEKRMNMIAYIQKVSQKELFGNEHIPVRGSTLFETSISVFNSTEKYLKINPIAYPLFPVHFQSAKHKTLL